MTKSPVARAEITVSPMGARRGSGRFAGRGSGGQTEEAVSDAEGRFAVEVPSAGGWSLSAAAHGYHSQAYEEHDGYSTAIILTEAKPVHEVTFQLTPAGAVEGYVLDEGGEAVRNAELTMSLLPAPTPEDQHPRAQARGSQRTDDRGYYKFSGLLEGDYFVRVQASPWYATDGAGGGRFGSGLAGGLGSGASFSSVGLIASGGASAGASEGAAPDPLDVVYPVVWYPGVTDFSAATPIALRRGETKEADFRLSPVPGFHLRIAGSSPGDQGGTSGRDGGVFRNGSSAYLTQVLPDGTESSLAMPARFEPNGSMEFAGLAPGTYVVHRQGRNDTSSAAMIRIAENSARTVDLSQAISGVMVTVKIDAEAERPPLQISFRNVESGQVSFMQGPQSLQRRTRGQSSADAAPAKEGDIPDRTISLQPGRYEVVLNGTGDLHLTRIEAKGASATGRTVTITGGAPVLTLHVANGRANVTGFVESRGSPVEGAMVLLVPATLGDPAELDTTRRDQSNSDGSFDITNVLPGAYILVAIDRGWDANWSDPATLRRFLMQGIPLDLTKGGDRKETIEVQLP